MAQATLSISSRNYGSWSLRGWLLCKVAGIDFEPVMVDSDDPSVPRRTAAAVALLPGTAA